MFNTSENYEFLKNDIHKLINELQGLAQSAQMRANCIIDNGYERTPEERAKSQGYVDAYKFCIFRLRQLV